mmetsp:Transcript_25039/g.56803  ORF Transcript_25039/g.56803 Transcript_25039/m.56803 type:complete len:286 (-) Transcript_25039:442-1299(-)
MFQVENLRRPRHPLELHEPLRHVLDPDPLLAAVALGQSAHQPIQALVVDVDVDRRKLVVQIRVVLQCLADLCCRQVAIPVSITMGEKTVDLLGQRRSLLLLQLRPRLHVRLLSSNQLVADNARDQTGHGVGSNDDVEHGEGEHRKAGIHLRDRHCNLVPLRQSHDDEQCPHGAPYVPKPLNDLVLLVPEHRRIPANGLRQEDGQDVVHDRHQGPDPEDRSQSRRERAQDDRQTAEELEDSQEPKYPRHPEQPEHGHGHARAARSGQEGCYVEGEHPGDDEEEVET